jgi:hypothetical protein
LFANQRAHLLPIPTIEALGNSIYSDLLLMLAVEALGNSIYSDLLLILAVEALGTSILIHESGTKALKTPPIPRRG